MSKKPVVACLHVLLFVLFLPSLALSWTPGLKEAADAFALGKATPAQEMMVFYQNYEINLLAQEGKISMSTYRNCQEEFFELNEGFANKAVRDAGYDPSISNRKYNPGTDTDVNVLGKSGKKVTLGEIKKIEGNYQKTVQEHFQRKGLKPPQSAVQTETDFMPHPKHTDPDEFQKIVDYVNLNGGTAYKDPRAASAQSKLGTAQPLSIDEASSFSSTMKDFSDTKINKANALRSEAKSIRGSNPGRAEYLEAKARQFDYQAAKYHNRIDAANNHLRRQNGLPENPRNITGFQQSADIIELGGRNPFTGKDASTIRNLHQSALQSSTDDMIDTLAEIARKNPSQAAQIQKALGKEISRLPPNRAGQAIERIENATKGVKGLDASLAKGAAAEARLLKQAGPAATKWASFKDRMKDVSGFNRMTKFSAIMTAGGAIIMAHQGISITLDNVKATDTLWDYFRNCYYHAAWEGTGIGPAFEQAQREEIERYMKEFEAKQSPSMVKHVTFTMLKTGVYMGKDAIIGVLYLPDTVWEYFTQEKEMEGYAAMQNDLARVMRQIIKDRKEFDQVMADMKKMGLHDSDALAYLNCLCASCGGTMGGYYMPGGCTSPVGHGPCCCMGPLNIWNVPLPAGNKEAQHECFNKVAKMRYNEARAVFDKWRQEMLNANAKSVQPELDAIKQDIANRMALEDEETARKISDDFAAIQELLLPHDVDTVRAMVGPYLRNHAAKNLETGDIDRAVDNLDRAMNKIGGRNAQEKSDMTKLKAHYEKWAESWREIKSNKFREVDELIRKKQVHRARWEIEALEHKMLKDPTRPLPPAMKDPVFLVLKERVAELGKRYEQAMQDMWGKVKSLSLDREHRQSIPLLEKALVEWDHPQHAKENLERQLVYHRSELKRAEDLVKLGQRFEKNNDLAHAVQKYEESLRIQKDSALERDLDRLRPAVLKQAKAKELWAEGRRLDQGFHFEEATKKYKEGLAIWTDPAIQARVANLEKYLADRKKQEAAKATQTAQDSAPKSKASGQDATASSAQIGQIAGNWSINANGFTGRMEFLATGGQLSGRLWLDAHKKWETLRDVRFDGRTLSFVRPIPKLDQSYTGVFGSDGIKGTFSQGGSGSFSWRIWRSAEAGKTSDQASSGLPASDPSQAATPSTTVEASSTAHDNTSAVTGNWSINANGFTGRMEFQATGGQLSGRLWLDAHKKWETLRDVRFDGRTLSFVRPIPKLDQSYTGVFGSDGIKGTFSQGGSGSFSWRIWRSTDAGKTSDQASSGLPASDPSQAATPSTTVEASSTADDNTGAVTGNWSINANGFTGRMEFQAAGGQLSGRLWLDAHKKWETLRDVRFDGRTLSFVRPLPTLDQSYTGGVVADGVRGTFNHGSAGPYKWRIWRSADAGKTSDQASSGLPVSDPSQATPPSTTKGASSTARDNAGAVTGDWSINANGYKGRLEFQATGGQLSGRLWLDAHKRWETLQDVSFDGRTLSFLRPLPSLGADQKFTGQMNGQEIAGTFTQKGTTRVFNWSSSKLGSTTTAVSVEPPTLTPAAPATKQSFAWVLTARTPVRGVMPSPMAGGEDRVEFEEDAIEVLRSAPVGRTSRDTNNPMRMHARYSWKVPEVIQPNGQLVIPVTQKVFSNKNGNYTGFGLQVSISIENRWSLSGKSSDGSVVRLGIGGGGTAFFQSDATAIYERAWLWGAGKPGDTRTVWVSVQGLGSPRFEYTYEWKEGGS